MAPPVRAVLDPNRISDGRAQPRASPSPNPRAVPSPVTTFSQRPQQAESISRFYSPPPQETRYTPPSDPSLTGSTESGNPYRPSSRHSQFDKSGSQLNLTGVALPASQPSNPSTHATERGRRTEISSVANAAPSRDTSSEHSEDDSAAESSDDEDPDPTPDQRDDPSSLAADAEVTQQRIKPVGGDQHTEFTDPAVTPASRDSSPPLSLDISTTVSINSSDSNRSPPRDPQSEPLDLANHGSGGPPPEPIQQLAEKSSVDQRIDIPDLVAGPVKSEGTEDSSRSHAPPKELLSLTDLGSDGPAATEAVKYLVQAVGRDVVSFRRNTQVSYMVVERARDVIKAINEYITKVEDSTTGDWDSFEKFTVAIEPLEDILFTLLAFTEDEKARYLASTGSIDDCISSAENWASNREGLSTALDGFDTRQEFVGLFDEPNTDSRKREHEEAQSHDDVTLLQEIRTTVKNFISEEPDRFPSYVREAETSLDRLQTKVINGSPADWLTVITVQTSMLVEGVLEMVKVADLGTDILNHLKSKSVWKAALELIQDLEGTDETQSALPRSAQMKYHAFVETLKKLGSLALPGSYVDLMKQAGRIRRPFQAQAFALVSLCRFLADKFSSIGESVVTIENVNALEEAFDSSLVALQAATRAVTELKAFDLTNLRNHDAVDAFGQAAAHIHESFKSFNLDGEWTRKQSELTTAFNKDKDRMAKLNAMLTRPQSRDNTTAKAKVNVTICDGSLDGMELGTISVEEESSMRLLALRWSVSGVLRPDEMKRARTAGTFFIQTDGKWSQFPAMHPTLAEITDHNSEVTLRLVVP